MSQWHREHPEEAEAISRLPLSEQNRAERAAVQHIYWPDRQNDLAPQEIHAGDEIEHHPESCGCHWCTPRADIEFEPWHRDPVRIAKLYRFLELIDETPRDVALFIEGAASYQERYEAMQARVRK